MGYLDNASVMQLTEVPEHLLVLGGGFIGLEFGQMFARFGSRVTIVHRGDEIGANEEPEIAAELLKILRPRDCSSSCARRPRRLERKGKEIILTAETPTGTQTFSGSHLLVGHRPQAQHR